MWEDAGNWCKLAGPVHFGLSLPIGRQTMTARGMPELVYLGQQLHGDSIVTDCLSSCVRRFPGK